MLLTIFVIVAPGADRPYVSTSPPSREQLAHKEGTKAFSLIAFVPDEVETEISNGLVLDTAPFVDTAPASGSIEAASVLASILDPFRARLQYVPDLATIARAIEARITLSSASQRPVQRRDTVDEDPMNNLPQRLEHRR